MKVNSEIVEGKSQHKSNRDVYITQIPFHKEIFFIVTERLISYNSKEDQGGYLI